MANTTFQRLKNRTMTQFFQESILPRQVALLTDAVQKTGVEAKREHSYRNRTGALESSIRWMGAQIVGEEVRAEISAGGPSKVRFAFDVTKRGAGSRRRNRRDAMAVRRGQRVNVNYAKYVEGYGYTVLTQFVRRNRPLFAKALGPKVRIERAA